MDWGSPPPPSRRQSSGSRIVWLAIVFAFIVGIGIGVAATLLLTRNQGTPTDAALPTATMVALFPTPLPATNQAIFIPTSTQAAFIVTGNDSTLVPLPTFAPFPTLASSDKQIFDGANQNLSEAQSYQFDVDGTIDVTGAQIIHADFTITGVSAGIKGNSAEFSVDLNSTIDTGLGVKAPITFRMRVTNDNFYMQAGTTGAQTTWGGVPISALVPDMTALTNNPMLQNAQNLNTDQQQQLRDLTSLLNFDRYIHISWQDNDNNLQHYLTDIRVMDFLMSDDLPKVVSGLSLLSGTPSDPNLALQVRAYQQQIIPNVIPSLEFTIDHYIDPSVPQIKRIHANLNAHLNLASITNPPQPPINFILDTNVNLSGYNGNYTVDIPPNAVMYPDLQSMQQALMSQIKLPVQVQTQ